MTEYPGVLHMGRCNFINLIAAAPELVASVLPAGARAAPLDTLPQAGLQPLGLSAAHCALTTQSISAATRRRKS